MSEDKVQFKSYLTKRTDRRFREFVAQKNPFLKGQLSYETEMALNAHMDRQGPTESEGKTHTHISTNMALLDMVKATSTSTRQNSS